MRRYAPPDLIGPDGDRLASGRADWPRDMPGCALATTRSPLRGNPGAQDPHFRLTPPFQDRY